MAHAASSTSGAVAPTKKQWLGVLADVGLQFDRGNPEKHKHLKCRREHVLTLKLHRTRDASVQHSLRILADAFVPRQKRQGNLVWDEQHHKTRHTAFGLSLEVLLYKASEHAVPDDYHIKPGHERVFVQTLEDMVFYEALKAAAAATRYYPSKPANRHPIGSFDCKIVECQTHVRFDVYYGAESNWKTWSDALAVLSFMVDTSEIENIGHTDADQRNAERTPRRRKQIIDHLERLCSAPVRENFHAPQNALLPLLRNAHSLFYRREHESNVDSALGHDSGSGNEAINASNIETALKSICDCLIDAEFQDNKEPNSVTSKRTIFMRTPGTQEGNPDHDYLTFGLFRLQRIECMSTSESLKYGTRLTREHWIDLLYNRDAQKGTSRTDAEIDALWANRSHLTHVNDATFEAFHDPGKRPKEKSDEIMASAIYSSDGSKNPRPSNIDAWHPDDFKAAIDSIAQALTIFGYLTKFWPFGSAKNPLSGLQIHEDQPKMRTLYNRLRRAYEPRPDHAPPRTIRGDLDGQGAYSPSARSKSPRREDLATEFGEYRFRSSSRPRSRNASVGTEGQWPSRAEESASHSARTPRVEGEDEDEERGRSRRPQAYLRSTPEGDPEGGRSGSHPRVARSIYDTRPMHESRHRNGSRNSGPSDVLSPHVDGAQSQINHPPERHDAVVHDVTNSVAGPGAHIYSGQRAISVQRRDSMEGDDIKTLRVKIEMDMQTLEKYIGTYGTRNTSPNEFRLCNRLSSLNPHGHDPHGHDPHGHDPHGHDSHGHAWTLIHAIWFVIPSEDTRFIHVGSHDGIKLIFRYIHDALSEGFDKDPLENLASNIFATHEKNDLRRHALGLRNMSELCKWLQHRPQE